MESKIICVSDFNEGTNEGIKSIEVTTTGDYFSKESTKLGEFICHQASSAFVESLMKTICNKMGYSCKKERV